MKKLIVLVILINRLVAAQAQQYFDTGIPDSLVAHNLFLNQKPNFKALPAYESVKSRLPVPFWPNRPDVIACYWRTWHLAFANLHAPNSANGFVSPYIDPAFNQHIFMWDTNFMLLFGQYGRKAFDFQGSADNFYHDQRRDGYICREIAETDGHEIFSKQDPSSTGPNILPWSEWQYFQNSNDTARLRAVFVPLLAYYRWYRDNRSWPDGSYYSTGWGCGMDNQPRVPKMYDARFSPAFMSWVDITAQQIFAGKILMQMARIVHQPVPDISAENAQLVAFMNKNMWSDSASYYFDRFRDGSLSKTKSVASYWALLAGAVPVERSNAFIVHLENSQEFNRLHRVPSLAADNAGFVPEGGYWRGGVWAPTTYMVLCGLTQYRQDSLAYEIAKNDIDNVVSVFNNTGILWENYAPDKVQGNDTKDLVGWTGLVPITELFEYLFGIRANVPANTLNLDIRMTDAYGIRQYPFGPKGLVDLKIGRRKNLTDKPKLTISSNVPLFLKVTWQGGGELLNIIPNR